MNAACTVCGGEGYRIVRAGEVGRAEPCVCQADCPVCRGTRFVVVREGAYEVAEPCKCTELLERIRRFNEARLPAAYAEKRLSPASAEDHQWFFDRGQESLKRVKHQFIRYRTAVDVDRDRGLVLVGGPGLGKTHLVCALLAHLTLARGISCRFVDFYQLLARIRSTFDGRGEETEHSIIEPLVQTSVLVIDDLGKGQGSAWELTIIDQLVTRRYNAGRIILATTNFYPTLELAERGQRMAGQPVGMRRLRDEEPLEERIGTRLVSRLRETCDFVVLSGTDFRLERRGR